MTERPARWRDAMERALYGYSGFFVSGTGPVGHFRTSALASPQFAAAVLRLVEQVDSALGQPDRLDLVDVGAGRGELLTAIAGAAPPRLHQRLRLTAVERAPRPAGAAGSIRWHNHPPTGITGVLLATEWLDNVPLDIAEVDPTGTVRYVLVDRTGAEELGPIVDGDDALWLDRWWPIGGAPPGTRAEIGLPRDRAWADAVSTVDRGLAVTVDYGHMRDTRPPRGTLSGYRQGRAAPPVPDGLGDLTAHVAWDAVAHAHGPAHILLTQREALHRLGVTGARPPLALASTDPAGYLRALAAASEAAELTDPHGLGGHHWLLHPVPPLGPIEFMAPWRT